MQYICWDIFFQLLRTVFELVDSDVLLLYFVLSLPPQQNISFCGLFSTEIKKSPLGWDGVNREGGAQGSGSFGQKLLNTQHCVGRCIHGSAIMKWANMLKESPKKIHRLRLLFRLLGNYSNHWLKNPVCLLPTDERDIWSHVTFSAAVPK